MRRYNMLIVGLLMIGAGASLIFTNPRTLPLWFVWLVGPFLWYVGIAVSLAGTAAALFMSAKAVAPTRNVSDRLTTRSAICSPEVPIEVLLREIETHVRLEQAAAESFLAFPSHTQLHSKTTSPFVN